MPQIIHLQVLRSTLERNFEAVRHPIRVSRDKEIAEFSLEGPAQKLRGGDEITQAVHEDLQASAHRIPLDGGGKDDGLGRQHLFHD